MWRRRRIPDLGSTRTLTSARRVPPSPMGIRFVLPGVPPCSRVFTAVLVTCEAHWLESCLVASGRGGRRSSAAVATNRSRPVGCEVDLPCEAAQRYEVEGGADGDDFSVGSLSPIDAVRP